MDSEALRSEGFSQWHPFREGVEERASQDWGVFVIRTVDTKCLSKSDSDIEFIGKAQNWKGLQNRLYQIFHPGPSQSTNARLKKKAQTGGLEVTWKKTDNPGEEKKRLLQRFLEDHGHYPRLNLRA
jgi:hypothetical protein